MKHMHPPPPASKSHCIPTDCQTFIGLRKPWHHWQRTTKKNIIKGLFIWHYWLATHWYGDEYQREGCADASWSCSCRLPCCILPGCATLRITAILPASPCPLTTVDHTCEVSCYRRHLFRCIHLNASNHLWRAHLPLGGQQMFTETLPKSNKKGNSSVADIGLSIRALGIKVRWKNWNTPGALISFIPYAIVPLSDMKSCIHPALYKIQKAPQGTSKHK